MNTKNFWPIFQFVSFQLIWILGVFFKNEYLAIMISILALHFVLSPSPKHDMMVLPIAIAGFVLDLALIQLGVFYFEAFPIWLMIIWMAFVLSLGHSLQWLQRYSFYIVSIISSISGMLSYWAGNRFEAVQFPNGVLLTAIILMALWAIYVPTMLKLDHFIRAIK